MLRDNKTLGEFSAGKIHVLIACRSHGVGISKWGAFGPAFASRSMTTDARSREPVSCFTNDIAPPRIKFKRLDKTARHIMQADCERAQVFLIYSLVIPSSSKWKFQRTNDEFLL